MLQEIFALLGVNEDDWRDVKILRQDKTVVSFTFRHRGNGTRYIKALLTNGAWQIVLDRAKPN